METTTHRHAVVVGASIAGVLAAHTLAERFERVTLIDRDSMPPGPQGRPGVPQGRHTHGLLAQGRAAIEEMVPGTTEDLVVQGALLRDAQAEGRWHLVGGPLAAGASALPMLLVSRPRLEWYLRQRLTSRPGVDVLEQTAVLDLAFSADERRVVGVVVRDRDGGEGRLMAADLVVDASGRTSRTPEWLGRRGYPVPDEEVRRVDKNSVTRVFRADPARRRPAAIAVAARPDLPRGGVMLAQERGRLTVTLAGCHGDRVPLTLPEFLDWARSLASTELAEAIEGLAPLDDGAVYRFPANRRRGYEHLRDFPERLVVTGDAFCSFDPVFGQGMTVAALEALELGRSLDEGMAGLARRFHARAAVHIDTPWLIAAGGTPPDGGRISLGERLVGRYVAALQRAAVSDPVLAEAFLRVSHLVDRPRELMRPGRAVRVLAGSLRSRRRPGEARRLPVVAAPAP